MPAEVADILRRIVARRREAVAGGDGGVSTASPDATGLEAALRGHAGRAVIAEVKLGSPRLGSLVERIDPERQAALYAAHGAAALSVVVEPDFFHGSYDLLARCRRASGLPALAKDFIVDSRQIEWAARAGASAVLLIAALHTAEELIAYRERARELGLEVLVETHEREDLDKLEGGAWDLVGVNNRDLRTFDVDLEHSLALLPALPATAVKVAESGLDRAESLARLEAAGFDAFLIGESLLLATDPAAKLTELLA